MNIKIEYGPNVEGKKQDQLYLYTDKQKELTDRLTEVQFAFVVNGNPRAVVISNVHLNDLVDAVGAKNLSSEDPKITKRLNDLRASQEYETADVVDFPEFNYPLHKYQKEAIMYAANKERYLLADHMGPQPLYSMIKTPAGAKTMRTIEVGDEVIDVFGNPAKVLSTETFEFKPVYRITLGNGKKVEASGSHMWPYFQDGSKDTEISTLMIREELESGNPPVRLLFMEEPDKDGYCSIDASYVDKVEFLGFDTVKCITVMGGLYVTDDNIITHNSGKAFTSIATALYMQSIYGFKHTLVINCINSNQHNYAAEVEKFTNEVPLVLGRRVLKQGPRMGQTQIKGNADKLADLKSNPDNHFLITNIEALRSEDIVKQIDKMIKSGEIGMMVVDEIHKVVKATSMQGKGLLKLRPRFRMAMSGTPFNKPLDMYTTTRWLGGTYANNKSYTSKYGYTQLNDFNRPEYVFTEHDKFREDIERFMLRRLDGLDDLPPISFTDYYLELGPEQRKAYEAVKQDTSGYNAFSLDELSERLEGLEHIEGRKVINIPKSMGLKEDVKLDALKDLLEEITSVGKTALVFTYFKDSVEHYKEELEKVFPNQGHFITEKEDPFTLVDSFQKGNGSFLVGSVGKIGTGLNITRADYVIFADRPSSWGVYEQAFMRPWRQGRKNPVHVIKLICLDTWDDAISLSQFEKKVDMDAILGKIHETDTAVAGNLDNIVRK